LGDLYLGGLYPSGLIFGWAYIWNEVSVSICGGLIFGGLIVCGLRYGVRELLFVISYRRFDLIKDFQDVYVTFNDPKDTCSNILKRKRQKLRYTYIRN
jgi:hypothetical protein